MNVTNYLKPIIIVFAAESVIISSLYLVVNWKMQYSTKITRGICNWYCQSCQFEISVMELNTESEEKSDDVCFDSTSAPSFTKRIEALFKKYLDPITEKIRKLEYSLTGI